MTEIQPLDMIDQDYLRVVVTDEPRGSVTEMMVSAEHDPHHVSRWALRTHDTATDMPEGVSVEVFSSSGELVA